MENHLPLAPLFSQTQLPCFLPNFPATFCHSWMEQGEWGMSCSQSVTFHLCCSFSSCSSHASAWGPTQGIQSFMNLPDMGPSPLLQYESFPWGTVHQECAAPTGCCSCLKTCFCVGFLHGPWLLSGACSSLGSPWAAVSFRAPSRVLVWCSPCAAEWIFAPLWYSTGCRRTTCIVMVFSIGCNGISALVPAELHPFLLHWPWHLQGWFSHVFSFLSHSCWTGFLSFSKFVITEVPLVGSAWASSGSVQRGAASGLFLQSPPPAKTFPWTHTLAVIPEQYAASNVFLIDLIQFFKGIDIKWLLWYIPKSDH